MTVFVVFLTMLGLLGFYIVYQLSKVDNSSTGLYNSYSRLRSLLTVETESQDLSNIVRSYLLTQDPKNQQAYDSESIILENNLQSLSSLHLSGSESKAVIEYQNTNNLIKGTELLILADVKAGSINDARDLFDLNFEKQQDYATSLITNFVTLEGGKVSTLFTQNQHTIRSIRSDSIIALSFIISMALIYLYFFSTDIAASIQALTDKALNFAKGDPKQKIEFPAQRRDEIGILGGVLNAMARELGQTLRNEARRTEELSQEKSRYLSSIDSLPIGFIMTDMNSVILNINPAMERMLRTDEMKKDDRNGGHLESAVTFLDQLLVQSKKALESKKPINLQELGNDEGQLFRAFFTPVLLAGSKEEEAIGAAILVEDVTEERIMARSKDEFFSIASHELRTPLTAIKGNTSIIQQFYKEQLKDEQLNEMVGDIYESSVRLIDIVNDFLDASRLEQGKMQFNLEEFSIEEIIEKVIYETGGLASEKKIQIRMTNDLGTLPKVRADKNKVKQVIYNLVGNSLKFIESGSVTISAKIEGGKFIKVSVIDTGRGISTVNQQILFHKFQQAGSSILTRDTTRGTGLGLYISKLLIEGMGGKIMLEHSEEGKGSTFSFTLPIVTIKSEAPVQGSQEGS